MISANNAMFKIVLNVMETKTSAISVAKVMIMMEEQNALNV